jgi:hypothetical protein
MKKILFLLLIYINTLFASSDTAVILNEIKQLREDMNKKFEQVDKRFEQVDKHFEQVEKRLDFLQNLVLAIIAVVIATPFIARKMDERDSAKIEKIERLVIVLRELAQDDPKIDKSMKIAGLS